MKTTFFQFALHVILYQIMCFSWCLELLNYVSAVFQLVFGIPYCYFCSWNLKRVNVWSSNHFDCAIRIQDFKTARSESECFGLQVDKFSESFRIQLWKTPTLFHFVTNPSGEEAMTRENTDSDAGWIIIWITNPFHIPHEDQWCRPCRSNLRVDLFDLWCIDSGGSVERERWL